MPGLVAFGRRWSIGSDDFLIPSFTLFAVHIIWLTVIIIALILDFGGTSSWPKLECKLQSLGLISCIFILILFSTILEFCLTIVSLRGSILNDTPRSGVPYLLYIRLFALILEIIWSVVALVWSRKFYFSCDLVLTKQVMIGLIFWVGFVLLTMLITLWCTYDVAGRSWVKMKRYQANTKEMEHRHPSFRRSGSTQRNWRQRKVMRQYESSWNNRCNVLFCCVHKSESSRDSFGELAKLLSEFFRDLDVVPSDIIVGLLLLRKLQRLEQVSILEGRTDQNKKRNNTYEFLSGIAITPNSKFVAMNDAHDLEAYHNVVYYMSYASAAYGWLWYVIPNGFSGLFALGKNVKCCFHRYLCTSLGRELSETVVEDNCCFCNVAVIPTMFDPSSFDIVYATYHVDVGETPFFVVVDYEKKAIVVSIRGTLSLKDLMTDLNAEAEPLPLHPVREDWLGHKGMVQAATYLKNKLLGENIINKAFEMCQSRSNERFNIVLVGHSLGGGAAAILAILLRKQFPDLVCYAYSPPGGLLSMPAVEYTKEFVTSVIVGKDLVPRIGLSQMEALRADLMNAIKKSHTPKWKTIMSGMKCCKCFKAEFSTADLNISPSVNDCSSTSQRSFQEDLLSPNDSLVSMSMHQPLYPPGKIMHVVRHHPKKDEIKYESIWKRIVGKREPVFQAIWTENTDYDEVLISPGMIQDHMPDNVLKALNRVTTSLGPAKPQRTLTNNASPINLANNQQQQPLGGATVVAQVIECPSNKQASEGSFVNEPLQRMEFEPSSQVCPKNKDTRQGNEDDVPVDDMDDMDEATDDFISLARSQSTETLFSLKINWDIFKELGRYPLMLTAKNSLGHNSSSGSSNCSELGTTMKEIFGPIKLYECTVPLASSETLSEISSMSSRASFIIKERSPLTKLKLAKNLSLRVHDSNGDSHELLHCNGNGGKSHQRSFSCVYPEGKKSNLLLNPFGTINGGARVVQQDSTNENGNYRDEIIMQEYSYELDGSTNELDPDPDQTPTGDQLNYYVEEDVEMLSHTGDLNAPEENFMLSEIENEETNSQECAEEDESSPGISENGEEYNNSLARSSKGIASTSKSSSSRGAQEREYSPVYPTFVSQDEYGNVQHKSPNYNYSGQSSQDSTSSSAHSKKSNNENALLDIP